MGRKILFFGDFGIDDVIALLYASVEDQIDVIGLVTGYGNIPAHNAEKNALFLRALTKTEEQVDIIKGAYKPYTGAFPSYPTQIHGLFGLGPLSPQSNMISNYEIHDYSKAVELIKTYQHEVTVVNVGRLSSLSTLFVIYPEVAALIGELYVMGGAFFVPGNVTSVAEANIHGDPYAANLVFTVRKDVKIIPLNVTNHAILTKEIIHYISSHCISPQIGPVLKSVFNYYFEFYQQSNATYSKSGAPIHDLLAMWAVTNPSAIQYIQAPVKVIVEKGEAYGQTIADLRGRENNEAYPIQQIAVQFDYPLFVRSIIDAFTEDSR